MGYADRLKKLNEAYKDSKVKKGGIGARPADGDYHLRIEKAQLSEVPKGKLKGSMQVVWVCAVAGGDDAGKKLFKNVIIEGVTADIGLGILKGDLETLGLKMPNISKLVGKDGILGQCVGKVLNSRLITNEKDPRWYKIYFNDLVEEMPEEDDIEPAEDDDDDDMFDDDVEEEADEEDDDLEEVLVEDDDDEGEPPVDGEPDDDDADEDEGEPAKPASRTKKKSSSKKSKKSKKKAKSKAKVVEEDDDDDWAMTDED